jgi:hypothetical protein
MSSVVISGDTSGAITLAAPATAGTNTLTLPAQTGTVMVNGPAFSTYQSVTQAFSASTWTKVQLQTKEFDTNSNFDNTTNYRFTPTVAGYYQVNGSFGGASSAPSLTVSIYKNGSIYKQGNSIVATTYITTVSALVYLNGSTDYIEMYGYLGSAINSAASISATYFNGSMVRGA